MLMVAIDLIIIVKDLASNRSMSWVVAKNSTLVSHRHLSTHANNGANSLPLKYPLHTARATIIDKERALFTKNARACSSSISLNCADVTPNCRYILIIRRMPPRGGLLIVTLGTHFQRLHFNGRNGTETPISNSACVAFSCSSIAICYSNTSVVDAVRTSSAILLNSEHTLYCQWVVATNATTVRTC